MPWFVGANNRKLWIYFHEIIAGIDPDIRGTDWSPLLINVKLKTLQ